MFAYFYRLINKCLLCASIIIIVGSIISINIIAPIKLLNTYNTMRGKYFISIWLYKDINVDK